MKRPLSFKATLALMLVLALSMLIVTSAFAAPWQFGVMSDTQWTGTPDDGKNPNSVPVEIIKQLNQQFINKNVKFVIQVGDLCDNGSVPAGEDTRAAFAQPLYNAGIGFFPFRGNHDSSKAAGIEFQRIYPQTQSGVMNSTPADVFTVTNPDAVLQPFPTVSGTIFTMGTNFSSPVTIAGSADNSLKGLTYSFDYNNARFVMLDGQAAQGTDGKTPGIDPQQGWINTTLAGKPANGHAFVFSHKGLITENHVDVLFGADPSKDPAGQNAFISSLMNNGVRYYMQGHDHMHDRSLIQSPDGTSSVQNILCASDSSKFYTPGLPSNDEKYNVPAFGHTRQTQIAQELYTVGYYIVTVDGPHVTVDYYSAPVSNVAPAGCTAGSPNCEYLSATTPALNFVKAETFGYSLNGHEYLVPQGQPYTSVNETYAARTSAAILNGTNGSTAVDFDGRHFTKTVDSGWTDKGSETASDVLTLWGMADLYADHTDTFVLSMSYDPTALSAEMAHNGWAGLATKDANGNWINAVDKNVGGAKVFVSGPWTSSYGLGTYGIDTATQTAWAVINHNSDFAVAPFPFTITSYENDGGNLTPTQKVNYNGSATFTATPDAGYQVQSILIDGADQGTIPAGIYSHTFDNVMKNHTIQAVFAPVNQVITSYKNAGGTVTPTTTVAYGTDSTFTATPDAGYQVYSVLIDGADQGTIPAGTYSYTFHNVIKNHTIQVMFAPLNQKITSYKNAGGTVTPTTTVAYGTDSTFTATPNALYHIQSVLVDGADQGTIPAGTYSYTFHNVIKNHTIQVTFAHN